MSPALVKPRVLMLGEVVHAKSEFESLSKIAEVLHVQSGTRKDFVNDCHAGLYDGVEIISRTVESSQLTGLFDPELIEALPQSVRFVCHNGAGYDQINIPACNKRGISVSNTPGAVNSATADIALFLLLGSLRRAWVAQSAIRAGDWRGTSKIGHDAEDKVLGILGLGGIGTAFAKRAAPLGFKIQYHNRQPVKNLEQTMSSGVVPTYVSFEELLRTSDVISIHLPLSPKTRHAIGTSELQKLKPGVVIINTSRGAVIDEEALVEALEDEDRIWSVGLDVFEEEPKVHPKLLRNEKVMLLPHIGTATIETQKKMEVLVIDNVKSGLLERKLLTPV